MLSRRLLVTSIVLSIGGAGADGQSTEYELAQVVNKRDGLMFDLQDRYWVLFNIRNGKSEDFPAAATAAGEMPAILDQFLGLMVQGSERGKAPGSRAKPEVWSDPEGFAAAAGALREAALTVAEVAKGGSGDDFAPAFDVLSAACTGCHGLRPSSGGPFRFAFEE